jgi:hypothetical protein
MDYAFYMEKRENPRNSKKVSESIKVVHKELMDMDSKTFYKLLKDCKKCKLFLEDVGEDYCIHPSNMIENTGRCTTLLREPSDINNNGKCKNYESK